MDAANVIQSSVSLTKHSYMSEYAQSSSQIISIKQINQLLELTFWSNLRCCMLYKPLALSEIFLSDAVQNLETKLIFWE